MSKKSRIHRKKADIEINTDPEKHQHLKELAVAFQEDQVKIVLRKLYKNVQQYGADVVLEAVNQSWVKTEEEWERSDAVGTEFVPSEASFVVDRNPEKETEDNPQESMIHNLSGVRHRHEEVLKRNALFLIESSSRLPDYDQGILQQMRAAFDCGEFDDVLDLAFLHDREKRPLRVGCLFQTTTQERPDKKPKMKTVIELLEEVAQEDSEETATQACVNALRHLSRDLTYEERSAAKKEIRRAIQLLE